MDFTQKPFGVPNSLQDSTRINKILKESLEYQKRFSVSNACGFVNVILKHCFEAAGIHAEIVYGTTKLGDLYISHVWLSMQGHVVDNTFVEDIPEAMYAMVKKKQQYLKTLDGTDEELFLGDQSSNALGLANHDASVFKFFVENQNKTLVMYKNKICLRLYYQSMVKMIKKEYGIEVAEVPNKACWSCGAEGKELKSCTKCKFALYCDKKCQKLDWKFHKKVCFSPE